MIYKDYKEPVYIKHRGRNIVIVALGSNIVFWGKIILSCFGRGFWRDEGIWVDDDVWVN